MVILYCKSGYNSVAIPRPSLKCQGMFKVSDGSASEQSIVRGVLDHSSI